ncbi:GtrA family protein [Luteibacter aegosomatissinici]|uniref:GtrA family protein n=1 Tax=Luteibacter aegosomatissinici TaxID=2911539 RepID=UPI001FFAB8A9|nr:GtrA family protein [Luteibacter aegosomatissinici]UPG96656.1 GtrA family protein [Luteibacter aegosomatissinici]
MLRSQFALFVLVGGTAAVVNFGSRILFSMWTSYSLAILLAYLLGMATAFCLNRLFVFRETTIALHHQMAWFVVVNLFAALQTLAISLLLVRWLLPMVGWSWQPELCAHAVGVIVPVLTSYIGHKKFSFR